MDSFWGLYPTGSGVHETGPTPVVPVVVRDDSPWAEADQARFLAAVTTAIEAPDAVRIVDLTTALAPIFGDEVADPADLWVRLLELHALGYFDVRQQPSFRQLASVIRRGATLPAGFADRFISTLAPISCDLSRVGDGGTPAADVERGRGRM